MPDDTDSRKAQNPAGTLSVPAPPASSFPATRLSSHPGTSSPPGPMSQIERVRVLVVDDERDVRRATVRLLREPQFVGFEAEDGDTALERIREGDIDVVLADVRMPRLPGMELLQKVREGGYNVEVIMMTALDDMSLTVEAVKSGAFHFLRKPFKTEELTFHVLRAAERKRMIERTRSLEAALGGGRRLSLAIGASRAMQEVADFVFRVAAQRQPVLILGESGTGKELIAREIHAHSPRARKPYVPVNCGAIPENLIESLLFGTRKGAFSGAEERRGHFEAAHTGTIFLDEIGDIPFSQQVKLLRVLQEQKVQRLGDSDEKPIDVRIIAATNADIQKAVQERRFREDLYYRLNVLSIHLPPLRERREDIGELAYHFLRQFSMQEGKRVVGIAPVVLRALEAYDWPGNVRELQSVIASGLANATGDTIELTSLPPHIRSAGVSRPSGTAPSSPNSTTGALSGVSREPIAPPPVVRQPEVLDYNQAKKDCLRRFEREYFERLMKAADQNISKAARLAGLDRSNFKRIYRRATRPEGAPDEGDDD